MAGGHPDQHRIPILWSLMWSQPICPCVLVLPGGGNKQGEQCVVVVGTCRGVGVGG